MKLIWSTLLALTIGRVKMLEGLNVTSPHCVFPFKYLQRLYYSCIPNSRMDHAYWCSKTLDYDLDLKWEFCTTLGAEEKPLIAQCTFPFIFANNHFTSCTKEGRSDNQLWCSTTRNYNKDGHWIFCNTPVTTYTSKFNLSLVVILCLSFALLCVCIVGCCTKFQWIGVKNRLWWSSRRGVFDNGKSPDGGNSPDSLYENIEGKKSKTFLPSERSWSSSSVFYVA
ncbi:72 kDa type IV collagenase-like [Hyla sarda]|uniref:72 kDa type IV collagenase-like n=1 Tax=Hyla sarda TaxID=327740 RepID=UPI0024C3C6B8|nr:72 kDa type IV collagenase-like [Hyla sarda]